MTTSTQSPRRRPFDDGYLMNYSNEHVYYEFDMFFWLAKVGSAGAALQAGSQGLGSGAWPCFLACRKLVPPWCVTVTVRLVRSLTVVASACFNNLTRLTIAVIRLVNTHT